MAIFESQVSSLIAQRGRVSSVTGNGVPGLAHWLLNRWQKRAVRKPQLSVLEKITLAPRQTLALIEADGQRLLLATSAEGAATFHLLNSEAPSRRAGRTSTQTAKGKR